MRIALLSYRSKTHCGGQGVYIRHLSRGLAELGHRVEVFSGQPYPELLDPRVRLTEVPSLDLYREPDPFRVPHPREIRDRIEIGQGPILAGAWHRSVIDALADELSDLRVGVLDGGRRHLRRHDARFGIESHRFREGFMYRPAREHFHAVLKLCPSPRHAIYLSPGDSRAQQGGNQANHVNLHD